MSKVHICPKQQLSTNNVEQKMRAYIAAWNREDLKVELFFDDLYRYDFQGIHEGKKVNRDELKQLHKKMRTKAIKARLVYFRKAGAYAYDMKISFVSKDNTKFSIRKLITVEGDKIVNAIDYNGTLASTKPKQKANEVFSSLNTLFGDRRAYFIQM